MKITKLILIILIFISCSKDEPIPPPSLNYIHTYETKFPSTNEQISFDIGIWMFRNEGNEPQLEFDFIADWLDDDLGLLEPINLMWIDYKSSNRTEAIDKIEDFFIDNQFVQRDNSSIGYWGFIENDWISQYNDQKDVTFSDVEFAFQENHHGRVFMAKELITPNGQKYFVTTAAFSKETSLHDFISFNESRDIFNAANGWVEKENNLDIGNIFNDENYTTADNSGLRVFTLGTTPEIQWEKKNIGWYRLIFQTRDEGYIAAGNERIVKLDNVGNVEWEKNYSNDVQLYSIKQTSDDGFISVGENDNEAWIIKLSSTGGLVWDKKYVSNNYEGFVSIDETNDGGYIVACIGENNGLAGSWMLKINQSGGIEWKTFHLYKKMRNVYQTSDGGYIIAGNDAIDYWLLKTDTDGNVEWEKLYGGNNSEYLSSCILTDDNGYILSGFSDETNEDYWIIKLNSLGLIEWQKSIELGISINFSGVYHAAMGNSLGETNDGGCVFITTHSIGNTPTPPSLWRTIAMKLDDNGEVEWTKTFERNNPTRGSAIAQTNDGGYILTESGGDGDAIIKLK